MTSEPVPATCILDPYGDIAGHLAETGRGRRRPGWDCFHTQMVTTRVDGVDLGIVTMALGAPWAVLVAERLAGSGCRVLLSISPALPVDPPGVLPCVMVIDRALRGEAVSRRYRPSARWSRLDPTAAARLTGAFDRLPQRVHTGASWSTAAPQRVPISTVARHVAGRIACVETDAAALYACGVARSATVVCLAHLAVPTVTAGAEVTWGPGVGAETLLAVGVAAAGPLRASATATAGR
jgi:hypothetical protein